MSIDEDAISPTYLDEVGHDRVLFIPGVRNARDVGGLHGGLGSVRLGRVFRSARLNRLTYDGALRLSELGLRTVIDLRTQEERDEEPNPIPSVPELGGVRTVVFDLLGTLDDLPTTPMGLYRHLVRKAGMGIVDLLEYLGRPDATPALIHCTAGKDRTGLSVALLLDLLGVPRETIVEDYIASNAGLGETIRTELSAEVLEATLSGLDRDYGGPRGYLEAHGLTRATVDALRATLLV